MSKPKNLLSPKIAMQKISQKWLYGRRHNKEAISLFTLVHDWAFGKDLPFQYMVTMVDVPEERRAQVGGLTKMPALGCKIGNEEIFFPLNTGEAEAIKGIIRVFGQANLADVVEEPEPEE